MIVSRAILVAYLLLVPIRGSALAAPLQQSRTAACSDWRQCRQLALEAAERGEYETFHDLAWRAVQTGPPRDPALMLLLARAQSLSGRPHDALVMLQRLADMGAGADAVTSDDFTRTRQLPGWPEVQARLEQGAGSDRAATTPGSSPTSPPAAGNRAAVSPAAAPPAAASSAAVVSPPAKPAAAPPAAASTSAAAPANAAAAAASPSTAPPPASEALRFSTSRLALGGLAYDSVSHRYLVGDRLGRKVMVVSEGSGSVVDLVRSDSAGFHDIAAVEVDAKRGDLWVASNELADSTGALHRLQLVSGRPLRSYPVSSELGPVTLVDLAIGSTGAVLALDSAGRQVLTLRAGGTSPERLAQVDVRAPVSLAVPEEEGIVYVAHADGISRVDLRAKSAAAVSAPKEVSLAGLERIRWYRRALIAVQVDASGSRQIVRLDLNGRGRAITRATMLEPSRAVAGKTFVTVTGDELVYLAENPQGSVGQSSNAASAPSDFVAYRLKLR
jgi:hypothetical protein